MKNISDYLLVSAIVKLNSIGVVSSAYLQRKHHITHETAMSVIEELSGKFYRLSDTQLINLRFPFQIKSIKANKISFCLSESTFIVTYKNGKNRNAEFQKIKEISVRKNDSFMPYM